MPRRCIAAGCSTASGEGYSLHEFPCDDSLRAKWTCAVKLQRAGWKGPTADSVLCSKHFEPDCFITEGIPYRDTVGIPAKKRLKPNSIPTIFHKPDGGSSQPTRYTFATTSFGKEKTKSSKHLANIKI